MSKKALILVDIQEDFLPGGALPVPKGNEIIPLANQLLPRPFDIIVATKDWHPADHGSFAANQGKNPGEKISLGGIEQILWPTHCVQETKGAEFPASLNFPRLDRVFFKGVDKNVDSYSAFFDNGHLKSTGLAEYLCEQGVKDVYVAGLATDYCVKYSVLDAVKKGFVVHVVVQACRGIDLAPGDSAKALEEMKEAGAKLHDFRGDGIRVHDLFVPNEAR